MKHHTGSLPSVLFGLVTAIAAVLLPACSSDDDTGPTPDTGTTAQGLTRYHDAATDPSGNPHTAATPAPQTATLDISVRGNGQLEGLGTTCTTDGAAGEFHGLFSGEAELGADGAYLAILSSAEALFETPSGCTIPDLQIDLLGEVVVRASISATVENCETYCAADARAEAELECAAAADAASCRAAVEADVSASCQTSCVGEDHQIVAETSLSLQALADLNAAALGGTSIGDLAVDLTFDAVIDGDGNKI
jgi:hypothetical protein